MAISVALAAYNGQEYIEEQMTSILKQLSSKDEVIVSIDPSTDDTFNVVSNMKDERIKVLEGPGKGVISNFENAIAACQNDFIFLSDQDDIWLDGKVETVTSALEQNLLVMHDAKIIDEKRNVIEPSFFQYRNVHHGIYQNIAKNSYIGCCMAFRKELIPYILPFPKKIPMHDQWIGLAAEKIGTTYFLEEPLLLYRRHEGNVSDMHHANMKQMIAWRMQILKAVTELKKRVDEK